MRAPSAATGVTVLPSIPVLVGLYHVVPMTADRVLVANAGRTFALSGPGLAKEVGPFLAALDGRSTRAQLEVRFPDVAATLLAALAAKGVLTDAAPTPDTGAGGPQLASLALPGAGSPAEVALRLAAATVAVAGCGPVGGHVAVLLAKAGVGRLLLEDPQAVAARDIAVSGVLTPSDEGSSRAAATARLCQACGRGVVEVVPRPLPPPEGVAFAVIELGHDDRGRDRRRFPGLRNAVPGPLPGCVAVVGGAVGRHRRPAVPPLPRSTPLQPRQPTG